jgi:hypothetical protein
MAFFRKISGSHFFRKLFILFTEISLKSRVHLKDPPPKLKASSRLALRSGAWCWGRLLLSGNKTKKYKNNKSHCLLSDLAKGGI